MENEENGGLIDKKYFVDQLERFFSHLWLSFYSLSLTLTLGHSKLSWSTLGECGILGDLEQEGKGRDGKRKRTSVSTTTDFVCRYKFACMFSSLVLACMQYACSFFIMICHWHA